MLRMCTKEDSLHDGREVLRFTVSEDVEPIEVSGQQQGVRKYELRHQVVLATNAFVDVFTNQRFLSVIVTEEHRLGRRRRVKLISVCACIIGSCWLLPSNQSLDNIIVMGGADHERWSANKIAASP